MAQYSKDGEVFARYSKRWACTLNYIFPEDPVATRKILKRRPDSTGKLLKIYNVHTNSQLVRMIFTTFLNKVLERVADGDLFKFPGKTEAHIVLKPIPDNEAQELRQRGYYDDYDIVKAGFKIPRFSFDFGPRYQRKDRGVYVPPELMQRALKNAENGQIPWTNLPKRRL